jgi:apolipoprotein N-acyltransferase
MEYPLFQKISGYFSTSSITAGFFSALSGSLFIYLSHWEITDSRIESVSAILYLLFMLAGKRRSWAWNGFFTGFLWFGWIGISFLHYGHPWAVPFVSLLVSSVYALYFWFIAFCAEKVFILMKRFSLLSSPSYACPLHMLSRIAALLSMSYIHPFGFDWFKPELVLVHTPFGVDKIRFFFLLCVLALPICLGRRKKSLYSWENKVFVPAAVFLIAIACNPGHTLILPEDPSGKIFLAGTMVPVEKKWSPRNFDSQLSMVLRSIDRAIDANWSTILFPESVLPCFLNREPGLLNMLKKRSQKIHIILGALYLTPDRQNRNAAYCFHKGNYTVANKVVLVPFGEANPFPGWAGRWINSIFFDGAPDYQAASTPTDFLINGKIFRPAVCFEGTSERLYADHPRHLLLLSNNGWFHPSVEPALQRLLLEYYHRKYGTAIWHSVNMGPSYVIRNPGN